jgi:hypothetical protein
VDVVRTQVELKETGEVGEVDTKEWVRRGLDADLITVYWETNAPTTHQRRELTELVTVPGVGPDAPTTTHPNGAKESQVGFAATSLPPKALLAVAAVQKHGDEKYGVGNWRDLDVLDHLNHAQIHYLAYMAGDKQDKHLEHYATRALMALELYLEQNGGITNG